jgi:hypothetical protein
MEQSKPQTKKQFEVMYGEKETWSRTTKAVYEHLFNGERRIVAANDQGISEQTMYAFIKNNSLRHFQQSAILLKAIDYRDAGFEDEFSPE